MSLDCPFLISPSIFSNVYFRPVSCVPGVTSVSGLSILDCPFGFSNVYFSSCVLCTRCCQCLWIVHSRLSLRYSLTFIFVLCLVYPALPVSLDCPFLIAPSVFSNVYFRPVSCVPGFTSVSGLSILDCPFGFPNVYFRPVSCVPGVASVSGLSILNCPFGIL